MRITGGEFKGRVFNPPKRAEFRPSTEKLRLSVFSMLDNLTELSGLRVLDCYAGSGAFGFEASSRGAGQLAFIERDRELVKFIQDVAGMLGLSPEIISGSYPEALQELNGSFELVFADPPYSDYDEKFGEQLINAGLVSVNSLLIVESSKRSSPLASSLSDGLSLTLLRDKRHGDSAVRIYQVTAP